MKEASAAAAGGGSGNEGNGSTINGSTISRSAVEKERTKMRERQRRSITTKIFNGLRKHGGYRLSPRADINQVLRELAKEAGWVVEPDGNTYRSSFPSSLSLLSSTTTTTTTTTPPPPPPNASGYVCQACGSGVIKSGTSTPTSSFIGGECSANASPASAIPMDAAAEPVLNYGGHCSNTSSSAAAGGSVLAQDINNTQLAMYMMYGRLSSGGVQYPPKGGLSSSPLYQQQQMCTSRVASNQNTPVGSPHRRS